jgi:predicted GNAT family N-acyltransferase
MRDNITYQYAGDPSQREAIYELRYAIYVEEMGRPQKDADHKRRRIEDRLDRRGHVFGAWLGQQLIGTVRSNCLRDDDVGHYKEIYGLDRLTAREAQLSSITTRLMVLRRYRQTRVAVELASAIYAFGLRQNILDDYIDCNAHLVPMFEHLGYQFHKAATHPEYGDITVMRLQMTGLAHLQSVNSPFVQPLREWLRERVVA